MFPKLREQRKLNSYSSAWLKKLFSISFLHSGEVRRGYSVRKLLTGFTNAVLAVCTQINIAVIIESKTVEIINGCASIEIL